MPSTARPRTSAHGSTGEGQSETGSRGRELPENGVDIEALAERIYRLLKEEACLERQRLGGRWRR